MCIHLRLAAGRGFATWRSDSSYQISRYVCDTVRAKFGKRLDNEHARQTLQGNSVAKKFAFARDNKLCCRFVCEIKRIKDVRTAWYGSYRKSDLFKVCPDAQVTREDRLNTVITNHQNPFLVSMLAPHSEDCTATRVPGSTDASPRGQPPDASGMLPAGIACMSGLLHQNHM